MWISNTCLKYVCVYVHARQSSLSGKHRAEQKSSSCQTTHHAAWMARSLSFSLPALLWKSELKYYYSAVIKLQHVKFKSLAFPQKTPKTVFTQNTRKYAFHHKKHNLPSLRLENHTEQMFHFLIFKLNQKVAIHEGFFPSLLPTCIHSFYYLLSFLSYSSLILFWRFIQCEHTEGSKHS